MYNLSASGALAKKDGFLYKKGANLLLVPPDTVQNQISKMSTPAQNTMNVNTPASIAAFQAKSAADKVLSYMWYIHVLVSVNTESRLRTKISRVLEHPVSPNDSSTESTDSTASFNHHHHQPSLNLIDHLVLWLFSHTILTRLVDVPPVYAQANGYTCILADVPVDLREEFARRLYTLLFSQHIVEWPHGIDVPEPCIPAAEPVVGPATVDDVSVKLEDTTPLSSGQQEDQDGDKKSFGGAGLDGVMESKGEEGSKSPASSFRPAASIWLQTPGLSSWDNDEDIAHMERATYFGTVSSPLPMDYFADWEWSRNGSGPHRGSIDEQSVSGVQLKAPFPSPLQQQQQQQQQQHISFDRIVQVSPRPIEGSKLSFPLF